MELSDFRRVKPPADKAINDNVYHEIAAMTSPHLFAFASKRTLRDCIVLTSELIRSWEVSARFDRILESVVIANINPHRADEYCHISGYLSTYRMLRQSEDSYLESLNYSMKGNQNVPVMITSRNKETTASS